jgi:hypothetical protein
MRQTFRNQTAPTTPIHVQRPGWYEFSKGPLQFEILAKKAPLIKNDGRQVKTTCINLIHNPAQSSKTKSNWVASIQKNTTPAFLQH